MVKYYNLARLFTGFHACQVFSRISSINSRWFLFQRAIEMLCTLAQICRWTHIANIADFLPRNSHFSDDSEVWGSTS